MCGWCLPELSPLPSNVSNLFNKLKSFSKADSHRERGETSVQTLLFRFFAVGLYLWPRRAREKRVQKAMPCTSDGHCSMLQPENNGTVCTVWLSWCSLKWLGTATSQQQVCAIELQPVVQSEPWGTPPGLNLKFLIYVNLNLLTVPGDNFCPKGQNPAHIKSLLVCTTTPRHFEKQKLDMDLSTDTMWWLSQEERVSQGDDRDQHFFLQDHQFPNPLAPRCNSCVSLNVIRLGLTSSMLHLTNAFAETRIEADTILGGFLLHLLHNFHTKGLHTLPLLFPLLLRTFHASISWFMSNSRSFSVPASWQSAWWAVHLAELSISSHSSPVSLSVWCFTRWSPVKSFRVLLPSPPSRCIFLRCILLLSRALLTSTSCLIHYESPGVLHFPGRGGKPSHCSLPDQQPWRDRDAVFLLFFCGNSTTFWFPSQCCDFTAAAQRCLCKTLMYPPKKPCVP